MDKVNIELLAEQYETLLKFLYFADYCAGHGFMSKFTSTKNRNDLYDLLTQIYKCGDKINRPKSHSMSTITSEVRFSDEESIRFMRQIESDLENIARHIFARDFAKQDLNKINNALGKDDIEMTIVGRELIRKRAEIYIKEFENNGIKNLKFKMFYKLKNNERDT